MSWLRQECMNTHWFLSRDDAKFKIEAWQKEYNERCPYSFLEWMNPSEYAQKYRESAQNCHAIEVEFLFKNGSGIGEVSHFVHIDKEDV